MVKDMDPWNNDEDVWGDDDSTQEKKIVDFNKIKKLKKPNDGYGSIIKLIILVVVILWGVSGFYQVQPSEEGVVLRFGKYIYTTDAGLHYHLPYPIEEVIKVNVTQERSINLGTSEEQGYRRNSFTESHMLTGDENIVDINLTIVWKVKSARTQGI